MTLLELKLDLDLPSVHLVLLLTGRLERETCGVNHSGMSTVGMQAIEAGSYGRNLRSQGRDTGRMNNEPSMDGQSPLDEDKAFASSDNRISCW